MWRRMTNAKNKITRRTVAKITKSKVELNEGDEGGVFVINVLGVQWLEVMFGWLRVDDAPGSKILYDYVGKLEVFFEVFN